jgi:trk system potassium uptake protein TrkA
MDIGTVINKKMIAASYIYQLTLDADVLNVRSLSSADAEVLNLWPTRSKLRVQKLWTSAYRSGKYRRICSQRSW